MKLRTYVVFVTNFPDEPTWLESGDLLRGPGLKTAVILVGMLKSAGLEVSVPCERDYYGWVFSVKGGIRFIIAGGLEDTAEGSESLLLMSDGPFVRRLFAPKTTARFHRSVLQKVNDFLHHDNRFHSVRWFTKEDFEHKKSNDASAGDSEP